MKVSFDDMKVPKSPEEIEHSTSLFLEAHGCPQCLGAINRTHIEVIEPSIIEHHYFDYINRKDYTSINVQAACDYKYRFMEAVVK